MFSVFKNSTVLITGNTGFKGSWLSAWLLQLDAKVIGLSLDLPSDPCFFQNTGLSKKIDHNWGDVKNYKNCEYVIKKYRPDFIFHLAAQPLVRRSYINPHETFSTNTGGTLNILEALRISKHLCTAVFITSDKCYDNVEQYWGYRENDRLGGKDPYSGSKGAAELIIRSYVESFFGENSPVRIGVGRAGNVVGGGDWADDRIVPDAIRAWSKGDVLKIRNPNATRPWQHVLEPISGYLALASSLSKNSISNGEAFNFGPPSDQNYSVSALLEEMKKNWTDAEWQDDSDLNSVYESGLLKLCCDKALHQLAWKPILGFRENIQMTSDWYREFYNNHSEIWNYTQSQINYYRQLAVKRGAVWA